MRTMAFILAGLILAGRAWGQAPERTKAESFWPNGNMKMLGLVKIMPNGKLVKDGRCTTWYENEKKQSEETWKDGIREGPARYWDENGKLVEQKFFRAGEPHGRRVTYWPNGKARSEQNYQEGALSGKETRWYSTGRKAVEGQWIAGKRDGIWQCWYRDGDLQLTQKYEDGHLLTATSIPPRKGNRASREFGDGDIFARDDFADRRLVADVLDRSRFRDTPSADAGSGLFGSYDPDFSSYDFDFSRSDYEPGDHDSSDYDPGDYSVDIPDVSRDPSDYGAEFAGD